MKIIWAHCGWHEKIKFSHTHYRALGPELIPVYRQSARRWLEAIHPAIGCNLFPAGLRLPSQPKNITTHRLVPNYTAWWQAHACEQLAQGCYLEADRPKFEPATLWIASERSTIKPHRPRGWHIVTLKPLLTYLWLDAYLFVAVIQHRGAMSILFT